MDAMRKRIQAFTEGVVLMVCPVLLAVALKKADMKGKGGGSIVAGSITPLAALTLEAGLLPFLGQIIIVSSPPAAADGLRGLLLRASKLLLHLCALLLMALAYGIVLLIGLDKYVNCLAGLILAPLVPLTLRRGYLCTLDEDDGGARELESSVDFSATVTTLLFLGLEGLALEGQSSAACHGLERLFAASLGVTYLTCALGVFIMLRGTVPPAVTGGDSAAELLNIVLAAAIALVVVLVTAASLREQAWLVFVPLILSFVTWMYRALLCGDGGGPAVGRTDGAEKPDPASLELTKVTFTGFLAVAVPTFSNTPVGIPTRGFVVLSAAAVISSLGWRLLTHNTAPPPAVVTAANVASFFAHLCVAAAVVPFATLAVNAINSSEPGSCRH
uniref:Uncharacterized protein n=1 Tax=Oryza brachyantha TaxID=4533 RepID=J3KZM3_ORYBR